MRPVPLKPVEPYRVFITIGPPNSRFLVRKVFTFKLKLETRKALRAVEERKGNPLEDNTVKLSIQEVLGTLKVVRFRPSNDRACLCLEGKRFNVYDIIGVIP